MSNPSELDAIAMFQAITGGDDTKARQYLQFARWNVELAVSNWFERGEEADAPIDVDLAAAFSAPPAPVVDLIEEEEQVEVLPGVYCKADNKLLPLKALLAKVVVVGFVADVELSQRFCNQHEHSIEAVFQFEHYNAALTNFEVEVDGKIYKGACKSKTKARETYDDAIASGFGAYMVEQRKREDVCQVSIGNLPPGKECRLSIRYVMELDVEEDALRFTLPATRTRLSKIEGDETSGLGIAMDIRMKSKILEITCPSAHKIESNITESKAAVTLRDAQPEGGKEFVLLMKVEDPHELVSVVEVYDTNVKFGEEQVESTKPKEDDLSRCGQPINVDPLLAAFGPQPGTRDPFLDSFGPQPGSFFSLDDFPQPRGGGGFIGFDEPVSKNEEPKEVAPTLRSSDKPHAVVLSLYPKIDTDDDTICELIFLLDRSGSMAGSRMNQAKNALQLFLRSLPLGTLFNIIGFGDKVEKLFPQSVTLDTDSLARATRYVSGMEANLGGTRFVVREPKFTGTDILRPLKDILSTPIDPQFPRQVFCLTDGEVDNTEEVLDFVKKSINESPDCRVFTFGIGSEASKALVRGIAKYGRGKDEFVVSGERMEGKVMRQLKKALQPILKNVKVDWSELPVHHKYADLEPIYPPLFDGERLLVYNFIDGTQQWGERRITVTGTTGEEQHKWEVVLNLEKDVVEGTHFHRLCARQFIKAIERKVELVKGDKQKTREQEALKKSVIELGEAWGLVSRYTSYVAVEERDYTSGEITEMKLVDVNENIISETGEKPDAAVLATIPDVRSSFTQPYGGAIPSTQAYPGAPPVLPQFSAPAAGGFGGFGYSPAPPPPAMGYPQGGPPPPPKPAVASAFSFNGGMRSPAPTAAGGGGFGYPTSTSLGGMGSPPAAPTTASAGFSYDLGGGFGSYSARAPEPSHNLAHNARFSESAMKPTSQALKQDAGRSAAPMRAARGGPTGEREGAAGRAPGLPRDIQSGRRISSSAKAEVEPEPQAVVKEMCFGYEDEDYYLAGDDKDLTGVQSTTQEILTDNLDIELRQKMSAKDEWGSMALKTAERSEVAKRNRKSKKESTSIRSERDRERVMEEEAITPSKSRHRRADLSEDEDEDEEKIAVPRRPAPRARRSSAKKASASKGLARISKKEQTKGDESPRAEKEKKEKRKKSAPIAKHSMMRGLDSFILLANADGSFSLTDDFLSETNLSKRAILDALPNNICPTGLDATTLWTTALALAFLEKEHGHLKDEWELVGDKSRKYLRKQLGANAFAVLFAKAQEFLAAR